MSQKFRVPVAGQLLIIALLSSSMQAQTDNSFCWMESFTRGAGSLPNQCPSGTSHELAACYTTCGPGYEAYSPGALLCEQTCPSGFTDRPGTCTKPDSYTVSGYPWKPGDAPLPNHDVPLSRCNNDNGGTGCYWSSASSEAYPNCRSGYNHRGDLVCSPDCGSMSDGGVFCYKSLPYGRAMSIPGCGSGLQHEGALCYPSCGNGYDGVGPVCWSQCPSDHPFKCGAACSTDEPACRAAVGDMVLTTVGATINIASMFFGGPGASTALREAMQAAKSARAADVIAHASETGESTLFNSVKTYATTFGKQFMKTRAKNAEDPRNKFWSEVQGQYKMISIMNKASKEFGADQTTSTVNLTALTMLDPTGLSSMVMSFTKYGSCSAGDFSVDKNELNYGTVNGFGAQYVTLIAQQPVTITRVASPALSNSSITAKADCIGKELLPGQSCLIEVDVNSTVNLDSEIRIYTDKYTTVPYPVHILANPNAKVTAIATPNIDEAASLTSLAGVWAYNNNQANKLIVQSTGQFQSTFLPSGSFSVAGDAGRAYQLRISNLNVSPVLTLNDAGDHLTGPVNPGKIISPNAGKALNVSGGGKNSGAPIVLWDNVNASNEQFSFDLQTDGSYRISVPYSGKVLDVTGNSSADGALIQQWDWNGGQNQRWRIEVVGDGSYYRVISVLSGLVLTVPNDATGNDVQLMQSAWKDAPGQHFQVPVPYTFIRRPWDSGCNAGEAIFAGMCYDVPVGWAVTTPGIIGKVCPIDWRDDGTSCWPPWTGAAVGLADPNGDTNARHPLVVTDSRLQSTGCPANYFKSAVYSCQPSTTSKNITTIGGHTPSN